MSFESYNSPIEKPDSKKELGKKDREQLVHLWQETVLGSSFDQDSVKDFKDDKEIKQWLYASLMDGIEKAEVELGFTANSELIAAVEAENDKDKKAQLQFEYILDCNDQFKKMASVETQGDSDITRWDTMPLTIRENKSFNCVGASMLGHDLLKKCEIENFFGNPTGHVINIVRLENDHWCYVDFRNDMIRKINPEIIELAGVKTLKLNDPSSMYNYVPMLEATYVPVFIIGNLSAMKNEASDQTIPNENIGKQKAVELMQRFGGIFDDIEIEKFNEVLYPKKGEFASTSTMEGEREHVKSLAAQNEFFKNFFAPIRSQFNSENRESFRLEMHEKRALAEKFLVGDIDSDQMSDNMRSILLTCKKLLEKQKQEKPEEYENFAKAIIAAILS